MLTQKNLFYKAEWTKGRKQLDFQRKMSRLCIDKCWCSDGAASFQTQPLFRHLYIVLRWKNGVKRSLFNLSMVHQKPFHLSKAMENGCLLREFFSSTLRNPWTCHVAPGFLGLPRFPGHLGIKDAINKGAGRIELWEFWSFQSLSSCCRMKKEKTISKRKSKRNYKGWKCEIKR